MAARSVDGDASNFDSTAKRGLMTKLSAEAYAIVEGRHSDPFHNLGLHTEGDKTVVRALLPEASKVDAIGAQGPHLPLKSYPMAFAAELRPSTASIVLDEAKLPPPRPAPAGVNALGAPMSIYEVHLGSWRRKGNNEWLT